MDLPTPRLRHLPAFLLVAILLVAVDGPIGTRPAAAGTFSGDRKLIETGWDLPNGRWLTRHLDERRDLPFDGMVFSPTNHRLVLFEPTRWRPQNLALDTLARIRWGHYTDNFILVWAPGETEMDWRDEGRWDVVMSKANWLSRAVAASRSQGIIFDPETYWPDVHPWAYSHERYPDMTFEDVETLVRTRGAEFMGVLASRSYDVKVLSYLSISYAAGLAGMDRARLSTTEYALLPAFTEGMLSAGVGTVIDGDELAYYVDETTEFTGRRELFDRSKLFSAPFLPADASFEFAEAIYMDRTLGLNRHEKGYPAEFSRAWFEHNIYHSLLGTDEYAWLYSEGVDWWQGRVPDGALEAVRSARRKFRTGAPLGFDMVAEGVTDGLPARLVADPPVHLHVSAVEGSGTMSTIAVAVDGAKEVSFYEGAIWLGTDTTAPFELTLADTATPFTIVARAFTSDSHTTSNILVP